MNNLNPIISEIGVIETALNIGKYIDDPNIVIESGRFMPFPDADFYKRTVDISEQIKALKKEKILILTPDIALIELIKNSEYISEILVCISSELSYEAKERISNNLPIGIKVTLIDENTFPKDFTPSNAAIVAVGYADREKAIILRENYKMLNVYNKFYGMKVLISPQNGMSNERPMGWIAINTSEFFTHICTEGGIDNVS